MRLTASFAVVLAVPLLAAVFVVRGAILSQGEKSERAELRSGFSAAAALYQALQQRAGTVVDQAAKEVAARRDVARAFSDPELASLVAARIRRGLDLMALVRADGGVTGLSAAEPSYLAGAQPPPFARVVGERPNGWAVLAEVRVTASCGRGCSRLVGSVVGGTWLDQAFVGRLSGSGTDLTLIVDGVPAASTVLRDAHGLPALRGDDVLRGRHAGRRIVALRSPLATSVPALEAFVSEPERRSAPSVGLALAGMFVLALSAGSTLAYFLARLHTRPIGELSAAAMAVSRGDFDRRIEHGANDELGELAAAFNTMTQHLKSYVGELESSRDEIRRSVRRLGETLQSTHDLTKLLSVVLETALVAVQGRAGAVYLLGATRRDLYVKVGRHLGSTGSRHRIPLGEGIAGTVARDRRPIILPGIEEVPQPHEHEVEADTVICVPLESQGQLIGTIALYGREGDQPFTQGDLDTIRSLAQQAAVGIDNVLLHQEAQRLSITDGLTGAWNFRYFQMRLAQEVERAIRFGRPFSMMILDIDHFKRVNDRYGHQRGDSVLVEVARRMVGVIRVQVDTLARYGGEEFVLILPETPLEGAQVVGEKILESIGTVPFATDDEEPVGITVSIGLATFPNHGTTTRTLVRSADQAMYEAKARGRNRLVAADELDRAAGGDGPEPSVGAPPVAEDVARPRPGEVGREDSTPQVERP